MSWALTSVLQIPELVYHIARFMKKGDLVRLVTVSKVFCSSTIPWIWETVYGAAPLFRLLPCTESRKSFMVGNVKYYGTFTFSKPLSQSDLIRLDFYAPFVKHLDIISQPKDLKIVGGWEVLINYVHAGYTFLPNLITLQLKPPGGMFNGIPPYSWAVVFCSPNMKSLSMGDCLAKISPRVGSALLGFLADRCPNLDTLEFQLAEREAKSKQDKYIPPEMGRGYHISRFLQSTTLCNLAINSFFANRYLLEISQSPCLKRSKIHSHGVNEMIPIPLPAGSFPTLRELKFLNLSVLEVESFWRINELVSRLTALECVFHPTNRQDVENNEATLLRFSNILCISSPYITDLTLDFDLKDNISLEANVLQTLAQLPLRKLSVEGAGVDWQSGGGLSACELLASTFPLLEVLRWPCEDMKYKDLPVFTTMPNLRHLAIELDSQMLHRELFHALSDIPRDRPLRLLEVDLSIYNRASSRVVWHLIARYLAAIWPDAQLTPRIRSQSSEDHERYRLSDDQYRMLNKFMLLQRGLDEEQAIDLCMRVSKEWFANTFPERSSGWTDDGEQDQPRSQTFRFTVSSDLT
ncbi:hypothetical protein BDV93DRAFT_604452 [Ceratobasidium sp. AG-I]|nr:hypothetical protein BDV93DRAFT_604452 [Ceratobasidium sp. AG-I]